MTAEEIINAVSAITGVSVYEMIAPGRQSRRILSRTLAIHEIRRTCVGYSLQDIGELFGMHHSNIAHSLTRHRRLLDVDLAYLRAARRLSDINTK